MVLLHFIVFFHFPVFFGAADVVAAVDEGVVGRTPGAEKGAPGLAVVVDGSDKRLGKPAM